MIIMARIAVLVRMIWLLILCQIAFPVIADRGEVSSAYFIIREHKRLAGHLVKNIESLSFMSCSQICFRSSWCTSTNFKEFAGQEGKGTCELNKHEFAVVDDNIKLIDQPDTTFAMILKGCLMTGCLNGGSCLFDKKKETFTCSCKLPWSGDKCEVKMIWRKVTNASVCFGARDDSYGAFNISEYGIIYTFKLVHRRGSLRCVNSQPVTYWGCTHSSYKDMKLATIITYPNKTALPLANYREERAGCVYYSYKIEGVDVNAKELVFNKLPSPMSVGTGEEFQIWFGGDLKDCAEHDNSGQTCADVYALYAGNNTEDDH